MSRQASKNVRSEKVMSPAEAAYLAGFIDGEGTISIIRATRRESRSGFRYQPYVCVANTNRDGLEQIRNMCGNGRLVYNYNSRTFSPNRKDGYVLTWSPNQIRHVLPQVMPYLILKRQQSDVMMEFLGVVEAGRPLSDALWHLVESLRMKIRTMNARGGVVIVADPLRTIRPSRTGNNQWKSLH